MLNPFPELLAFGLISPFIVRVCLGVIFIRHGYFKLFKNRTEAAEIFRKAGELSIPLVLVIGSLEIVGGTMLLAGFLTQIAALGLAVLTLAVAVFKKTTGNTSQRDLGFSTFLFLILTSLLFSGAGFFAFDLPL